jgi:multiple sugar transport system substrate-binding protein
MSMFAAGTTYDVQRIDDDRVGELALAKKIHQLDQWMLDASVKKDDFYPLFWTTINLGGYQFCVNPVCGSNVLYYNQDLWSQAGLPPPPTSWKNAWSWDEFVQIAEKLVKKDARGKTTQYALGFPVNVATPIAYGAGGSFLNQDETKCTMTDPAVVDAIDKFVQLTKPGGKEWFVPSGTDPRELFNGGRLAMIWDSMDFVANISKSIKWDIAPWMKTPKYAMTENYDRTFVISKTAKSPEQAFKALWAQTQPPLIEIYAKAAFGVPYHKATTEGPLFLKSDAPPKNKQIWVETMQLIDGRPIDVPTPRNPAMEDNKNTFVDEKSFGAALSGQISAQQYLEAGCKKSDDSIKQYNWKAGELGKRLEDSGAVTWKGVKVWPQTPNP